MFTETPTAPSHHPSLFLSLPLSFSSLLSPWRRKRCAETWANPASCKTPNSRQNWMLGLGVCAFTSECVCVRHSMRVHKCVNNCICLHVFVCLSEHVCVNEYASVYSTLCVCERQSVCLCVCVCVHFGEGSTTWDGRMPVIQHPFCERDGEWVCYWERGRGEGGGGVVQS